MKFELFTKDLGQKLLDEGCSLLVHSHRDEEFKLHNPEAIVTLEPTKELVKGIVLPIKGMINLPEDKLQRIYVRLED